MSDHPQHPEKFQVVDRLGEEAKRIGAVAAAIANEVARIYSEDRIAFATAAQRGIPMRTAAYAQALARIGAAIAAQGTRSYFASH